MEKYDIFISYRRDGGFELAQVIYEKLSKKGYRVFMDIEALRSGKFNEKLFSVIHECSDFILILSPHALDRCRNDGDWVRTEIEFAMNQNKNIIPIEAVNFTEPDDLPESMKEVLRYNRVIPTHSLFNEAIDKLCREFLQSQAFIKDSPSKDEPRLIDKINKLSNIFSFILLISLIFAGLTRDRSPDPDFSSLSGIMQFFLVKEDADTPEFIKNFYAYFAGNEALHFLCKQMFVLSLLTLVMLDFGAHNFTEVLKDKFKGRNFQMDVFSEKIDHFVRRLMQIEDNDLIVNDTVDVPVALRSDVFASERNLKNLFIGSVDGEQIDYLRWQSNNTFSLFNIGEYTTIPVINMFLAQNGFTFIRKENGVFIYQHKQFELRMNKELLFWSSMEIRRRNVPYSCFIPQNIGFEEINESYDDLLSHFFYMRENLSLLSCFSECDVHTEDFFEKYQVFFFNSHKYEIGSCDGNRVDYFLCHVSRIEDKFCQILCRISNGYNPDIRLFGTEYLTDKDNIRKALEQAGCTCLKTDKKHLVYENAQWMISVSYFDFECYLEVRRKNFTDSFGGIKALERKSSAV